MPYISTLPGLVAAAGTAALVGVALCIPWRRDK